MSDVAYIMETQDPCELWLVEGENKFKVSRDMYWLLASNGADLPPTHHITELLTENAKLRELLLDMWNDAIRFDDFWDYVHDDGEIYDEDELPHYQERMRALGIEVEGV